MLVILSATRGSVEWINQMKSIIHTQVDALLNDTTGCLLACAYKRPECAIGVIIGTGINACYVEELGNAELYEGDAPKDAKKVLINTEWGAFGSSGALEIIRTKYDIELDFHSRNPGQQIYEKLISGMYLGEIVRLVIHDAVESGILFEGKHQPVLDRRGVFLTKFISDIEADVSRESFENMEEVLRELGLTHVASRLVK